MKISEFRERMRDYVEGDQASLDDEEWWVQVTDLSLLVLAERARVKRARRAAQDCPARYQGVTQCSLPPNHRGNHFSPSIGRWKNDAPVHDVGEMTYAEANELVLKHQREKAERQRNAAVNAVPDKQHDVERCPATWNPGVWSYTTRCVWRAGHEGLKHVDRDGNTYTETVEQHRFSFEGSTTQLASHLVRGHGLAIDNVQEWSGGLTQGDWTALDELHRDAHRKVGESYDGA